MHDWVSWAGEQNADVDAAAAAIKRLLEAAQTTLGMDVAYVSALSDGVQTFTHLSGDDASFGWQPGTAIMAGDGYCQYVLSGDLPNAVADSRAHPIASQIPATEGAGIGSYVGVPLALRSGRIYGALCATSHDARERIPSSDVAFLHFLAKLVGDELAVIEARSVSRRLQRDAISAYLVPGGLDVLLQPIVEIATGRIVGAEALARFPGFAGGPAQVFAAASQAGMGVALELAAVREALQVLPLLPADVYLAVNASPETVADPRLADVLATAPPDRLVLELTEHVAFGDHASLVSQLAELRSAGLRVAVDDTGAGFASLQNILALAPDVIKLDLALVTGVDRDPVRRALTRALAGFAAECGAVLVAEGIETAGELETLRALGVALGQGYHLGRPQPAAALGFPAARAGVPVTV